MPSWRQQALIEASVEDVWGLVGDPREFPRWASDVLDVTGLAEVAPDARFKQVSKGPLGKEETTFRIDALEDMREIKLVCELSGYYSRWVLTEAQESTFVDVEMGIVPTALQYRLYFGAMGKRHLRRLTEDSVDGLRKLLTR